MTKEGFRIWEITDNGVPKEIISGTPEQYTDYKSFDLDLKNKSYAIRVGKNGLK